MTEEERGARRRWLPFALFLTTVATTWHVHGVWFSVTLMGILVAHEMGHFVVARRHGVPASFPHFIPIPPLPIYSLGTLGAVISMRTDRATRNQLLDIGAAGPIAGFVVAVPAMIIGLQLSEPGVIEGPAIFFGDSLLSWGLTKLFTPELPPGQELLAHPVFIGAWAGFLVTAINLLPMGQLDGGHVLHAFAPSRSKVWMRRVYRLLIVLGVIGIGVHGPAALQAILGNESGAPLSGVVELMRPFYRWVTIGFLIWALFGRATGLEHPPVREVEEPLTKPRRLIAYACLLMFALTFMPNPIWGEDLTPPQKPEQVDGR